MNPWVAFIIGLLVGWLIEWVIDWIYWRRRGQAAGLSADCKAQINRLEGDIAGLRAEKLRLENLLSVRDAQVLERNNRLAGAPLVGAQVTPQDDLTQVQGVDADMVERLHRANIHTFAELGALRPARLREILGDPSLESGSEIELVKNARLLSGSLKQVDDLELINGIGPVIAKILYSAGIFSFADVADLSPDKLRAIVGERIERLADEDKILVHARQLASRV